MLEILTTKEFNDDYAKLKVRAASGNGEAKYILKLLEETTKTLENNREAGEHIQRNLWPKEYVRKYEITNLWKINLDSNWRLIYTIDGNKIPSCASPIPAPRGGVLRLGELRQL